MKLFSLLLLSASVAVTGMASAQEIQRGPDGGTSTRVGGVQLLPIPGAPLSGKSTIVWKRTLADGTTVTTHETSILARDSEGRMYRERHNFVPLSADPMSRWTEIQIFDPVKHTKTICNLYNKHCELNNYYPQKHFAPEAAGWNAQHTSFLERVSLGTNQLQGVDVIGSRETVTTDAGVKGNDHPLVTSREFWYNPALQTNLMVTRVDPITGTQLVKLTELSVTEPDPAFFMVPDGYLVEDKRVDAPIQQPSDGAGNGSAGSRPEYNGKDIPAAAPTDSAPQQ